MKFFALAMFLLLVATGAIWLLDHFYLRARRVLVGFRYGHHHRQVVADVEGKRLDQDVLVALELAELTAQVVEPTGDRRFSPIATIRRQKRRQRRSHDRRLRHALLRGQLVEPLRVLVLDEGVEAKACHNGMSS